MGDQNPPLPGPQGRHDASGVEGQTKPEGDLALLKEQPVRQAGVTTENLVYTEQEGGARHYPAQKPVETTEDPTPQPEVAT